MARQRFPLIFWLRGEHTRTPAFEVGWVEFNFWLRGAFSLLNMDVLAGEQLQVEGWFFSAVHHFPWTYTFGKENWARLCLNLFCLDPPIRNTNKNCQIVTVAELPSVQRCDCSCLQICEFSCLVTRLASQQRCEEGCVTCNYTEKIAQVDAASKRSTNICLSWQ